jgi:Zn-dependent protease
MLDLTPESAPGTCDRCGTQFPPGALACPSCGALVHRARLKRLADVAGAAMASGNHAAALPPWQEALALVPAGSEQHRIIGSRITELAEAVHSGRPAADRPTANGEGGRAWWKHAAGGAVGIALLLATKLKFLLLGLTKLSTFASMFGFIAVYWSIHGWPLAVGLAGSIYIHEMGHVSMLRRLGIQAGAPLFIPGVGALVMLKERVVDPIVDARIGLAGPVWGLGAAVASWVMFLATGADIWRAIAELTGFLNLFNLMPVWQLDGARGFHALSRQERWGVTTAVGIVLWLTGVRVLWLVGAVALYRTIKDPGGPGHARTLYTFLVLIGALSWFARAVP